MKSKPPPPSSKRASRPPTAKGALPPRRERAADTMPSGTRRDRASDTMTVFLDACREVIEALESLGVERLPDDDHGRMLLSEARDIVTFLQIWKAKPPASADRRDVVARILKMHAAAAIYLDRRRAEVIGNGNDESR